MNKVTQSLGFRLIGSSFIVVSVFIFLAGVTVFKISQDAITESLVSMVGTMAKEVPHDGEISKIADVLVAIKIKKAGSVWLMDSDGYLLYHQDPTYRQEYVERRKNLGNIVVSLQYASPRQSGQGSAKEKLVDIIKKYGEGFGTYQQYGETRVMAFQVIKDKGWLIGLDEPEVAANSELYRIRKYIRWTGFISAVLILLFTWLAIRIIVKPYYREVEDLNLKLQKTNKQISESNALLESSNKKLTALYRISITMQETMSLHDILDLIAAGAQEVLGVDRIAIMLPDKKDTLLECRAAIGLQERRPDSIQVPLTSKGGALAAAYKRGQVIKIAPGERIPPHFRLEAPYAQDPVLRSMAFVVLPMVVKNKSVGVIAIDNKASRKPIMDDQISLIQIFANQAAVAVENARLYEDLKRNVEELDIRVDQLAIVNQISNTMQSMVKKKEMLGFILRGIRESIGFDYLMICMVDREEDLLRGEVGINVPEERIASLALPLADDDRLMALAIGRGMPLNMYSESIQDFYTVVTGTAERSALKESAGQPMVGAKMSVGIIPVRVLDKVAGLIALGRTSRGGVILKKEIELLMLFGNTIGLAVERAELYEKLNRDIQSLEITDHISKLFTFTYGQQRVSEELSKSRQMERPLSVIMLGIDGFKEFNDRCGQEMGNKALSEIAGMIRKTLTENDMAFRYGGRLICCILPGKQLAEASGLAERLRDTISRFRFKGRTGALDEKLTVSGGVYTFNNQESIQEPPDLFKMAMALLHRAEAAGENRVLSDDRGEGGPA